MANVRLIRINPTPDDIEDNDVDVVHCYDFRGRETLCGIDVATCVCDGVYNFGDCSCQISAVTCEYCKRQIEYIKSLI